MFKLEFATDNDAFTGEDLTAEVSRIMRAVVDRIEDGFTSGVVRDINGNSVGTWEL